MVKKFDALLAYQMFQEGKKPKEVSSACMVSVRTARTWKKRLASLEDAIMLEKYLVRVRGERVNPCSVCQTNILLCPWLHEHKPVEGWDAELVLRKTHSNGETYWEKTWSIKSCPLYQEPKGDRANEED